jgi:hypothetical protein
MNVVILPLEFHTLLDMKNRKYFNALDLVIRNFHMNSLLEELTLL